jgi:hypothetical protein
MTIADRKRIRRAEWIVGILIFAGLLSMCPGERSYPVNPTTNIVRG